MRSRPFRSALAGALLLAAGAADGGTLTSATWTQALSPLPGLAPIQLVRTSAQLGAVGTSTATSISIAFALPALATSFLHPTSLGMASVFVTLAQGGGHTLTATAGMASGAPAIPGGVVVRQSPSATKALLTVPLHHGAPTRISVSRAGTQFAIGDFFGWFPHAVTVTGLATPTLTTRTTFMATGTFDLDAQGGGTVTLVAPARLYAVGDYGIAGRIHSFTTLTLHFVPEPAAFMLLGAALVLTRFAAPRRPGSWGRPAGRRADPPPR